MTTPFEKLWFDTVAFWERKGANCDVTLHALSLSLPDIRGVPTKVWVDSTIKMVITDPAAQQKITGAGLYSQLSVKAKTDSAVYAGDEVTDSFGNVWAVTTVLPYSVGNVFVYYDCALAFKLGNNDMHPSATVSNLTFKIVYIDPP